MERQQLFSQVSGVLRVLIACVAMGTLVGFVVSGCAPAKP